MFASIAATALFLGIATIALANARRDLAACLLSTAAVEGGCGEVPNLTARFSGQVMPKRLPKHEPAPAALALQANIATTDGIHPSALRKLTIDFDRNVALDARGLAVCDPFVPQGVRPLTWQSDRALQRRCRRATVGGGTASFGIALHERTKPLTGKLILYNGGLRGGVTTLFAVAFVKLPTSSAIVISIRVTPIDNGRHGLRAVAKIPRVARGHGSLLAFSVRLKRFFTYKQGRRSLVTARCPDGKLRFDFPKLLFRNEARTPGVAPQTVLKAGLLIPCEKAG